MSVIVAIIGFFLIMLAVVSSGPPGVYAWLPGIILLFAGLAGEARRTGRAR